MIHKGPSGKAGSSDGSSQGLVHVPIVDDFGHHLEIFVGDYVPKFVG